MLGPQHGATIKKVIEAAKKAESTDSFRSRMQRDGLASAVGKVLRTPIESPTAIDRTYHVLTGQVSAVQSRAMSRFFGGMRSAKGGAVLGSAIGTAVPGDTATLALTAKFNGMSQTAVIARVIKTLGEGPEGRQLAAAMQMNANDATDAALNGKRFSDETLGSGVMGRVASTAIRITGLQKWTGAVKTAFEQEFSSYLATSGGKAFHELDEPLQRFLQRAQLDQAAWDTIRSVPTFDVEGGHYVDFDTLDKTDRMIGDKLLGAIIEEGAFATLEPDARVRQLTTGGLQAGSFWGEMARSTALFKSFALTQLTTHIMTGATQETAWGATTYLAQMGVYLTLAGALGLQVKQYINGKNAQPMNTATFWGQAVLTGGALEIFADLLNGAVAHGGQTSVTALAGPQFDLLDQAARLASGKYRNLM